MHSTQTAEQLLKEAFKRFDQSSQRLQERYEELLQETEGLRRQVQEKDLELKRSEKLALLGETAAALAHEVRNPLGSIKLFVSLLRKDLKENPACLTLVENIDSSVSVLDNVVSNILSFSKNERLDFSPVNLHSLIQEHVTRYDLLENHEIKFSLDLRATPFIFGNEHALRQVFHNLILNAAQAIKNKGTIMIETADSEEGVIIGIADNGPGIKEDIRSKIFDPFVTSKNEGTGLGLAVVSQIIASHRGRITAENLSPNGAKFTVFLARVMSKEGDKR